MDSKKSLMLSELGCWESYMEGENPPHIFYNRTGQEVCSLSTSQLYFTPRCPMQMTVLENISSNCLAFVWDKPNGSAENSIFSIKPRKDFLFPGKKMHIECKMMPKQNDYGGFYSNIIYGRLYPFHERNDGLEILKGNSVEFPTTFNLSLVGKLSSIRAKISCRIWANPADFEEILQIMRF